MGFPVCIRKNGDDVVLSVRQVNRPAGVFMVHKKRLPAFESPLLKGDDYLESVHKLQVSVVGQFENLSYCNA
jgi:hypothetical protein